MKDVLQQQFSRISEIEKKVLSLLAKESDAINLAKLLENGRIPGADLINALQSLLRRCLIEEQGRFYTLPPVLKQYAITYGTLRERKELSHEYLTVKLTSLGSLCLSLY
ncbi:MAG: hypothetical protein AB1861_27715 [Cyanobacteriota bacterium]